jgi:hypothetical protein
VGSFDASRRARPEGGGAVVRGHRRAAAVRSCGGDGRKQDEKGDPGSKEGNEGVWEVRLLTRNSQDCLVSPEEGHRRRNRRFWPPVLRKKRWRRRRLEASRGDSFHQVEEEDVARRLAVAAALGVAGVGGTPTFCSRAKPSPSLSGSAWRRGKESKGAGGDLA